MPSSFLSSHLFPFFRSYATKPYLNNTRQALSYAYPSGKTITSFTAEELAAMVLTYARDITKDFGGLAVRDCVLTVPSFATMHERRALITSAEIAGLKVLSLIEDNTAAALHYGKDNVFENTTVCVYEWLCRGWLCPVHARVCVRVRERWRESSRKEERGGAQVDNRRQCLGCFEFPIS